MYKRILSLLLAVVLAAALCSCGEEKKETLTVEVTEGAAESTEAFLTVETTAIDNTKGYEYNNPRHCYQVLPLDSQRELYELLYDNFRDISAEKDEESGYYPMPQVKIDASLSEAQVRTVIKAIYNDYPELFWAAGTIGFYSDEEVTIVRMYSSYSPEEVDEMSQSILDAVADFLSGLIEGLPEYELELKAHDYLLKRAEYDEDVDKENTKNNDPNIYTAYGPLVNRIAVCEGYARAYQLLMNNVGLDCVGISGMGNEDLHMWNAVNLGGEWYLVDPTWDDHEEPCFHYDYFNLTTEQMNRDHTPSPMFDELTDDEINGDSGKFNCDVMNMFVPVCTDPTMGYYWRSCPWLSDYDGSDILEPLYKAALNREEQFMFYVDESLDFYETLELLFSEKPQYFFGYVENINNRLPDYSIDTSNIGYVYVDKCRVVTVELNYL